MSSWDSSPSVVLCHQSVGSLTLWGLCLLLQEFSNEEISESETQLLIYAPYHFPSSSAHIWKGRQERTHLCDL